jgi:plastocyanin
MRRVLVLFAAASLIALTLSAPALAATKTVNGSGTHWSPATVTISKGDSVRWHASSGTHHVKAYGGNWTYSKQLSPGSTTPARKFRKHGTFKFFCTIHGSVSGGVCSGMCGKVVVP